MERRFELRNYIDIYGPNHPGPHRWVNEVIESIENDELLVFDPKDGEALRPADKEQYRKINKYNRIIQYR